MFKSLKLCVGEYADFARIESVLVDFGYHKAQNCSTEGHFSRRGSILDVYPFSFELPVRINIELDSISFIKAFNPDNGELLWDHQIIIILPVKRVSEFKTRVFNEDFPVSSFVDLNVGDYVVHNEYGIGRFLGLEKIKGDKDKRSHIVIEYDRQEKLFVPIEKMHLVQKYITFASKRPRLYRLGSKEWQRVKNRAKKGIQKLAWELLSLEAMRLSVKGFQFLADSDLQREFESGFPYKETPGQIKAMQEVKSDMESSRVMDRLLCGDVGYGKTEVALRAAFKAVVSGKQVAYLAPTTILVEQLYQNIYSRLKDMPVNVDMLSRFRTKSRQKDIIRELAKGNVDIVIGTHRLLSDDIKFRDLGLVIIDEEQRFGVKAKQKLKSLRLSCDVLTLTATPIPRTLYMSLMGAKDLSIINTPPQNRLPIRTSVVEYDTDLIKQAVMKELSRGGQVYFVHNRVYDIDQLEESLAKILPPSVNIAVAHGQMPASILEDVMLRFLNGQVDVLLCTMIIESGIDIPNVNTIIVNNAHTFGLSDLHQLRGRVGRFDKPAYAYFLIPKNEIIESQAAKRLSALEEHSYIGAGFKIAMEDLELRGAGNLLGAQQHGFIDTIGFDLYCRLLREAIGNFKKILLNGKRSFDQGKYENEKPN
ncbi:MAG: transcription-repair coupling factor [Candidatus Omnitrophota bacterium]|jgi:transcription-repair coupling factor (superfamily II helicase)|nr:MAG: transcription-repair coupling factor [Candidatus Omnitrophota bacterium]